MKQSKLTLVVDPSVVRRAKTYASSHRTSVSSLVEAYLRNLTVDSEDDLSEDPATWPPITRSLLGSIRSGDNADIDERELKRRRLAEKYLHD